MKKEKTILRLCHLELALVEREFWIARIRAASKYAIRAATMNGKKKNFDPDALIQNMIVGMLGYHTKDGLSDEWYQNPTSIPSRMMSASEALFGFISWICGRDKMIIASRKHECGIWATLVNRFISSNNLYEPKIDWEKNIKFPKED